MRVVIDPRGTLPATARPFVRRRRHPPHRDHAPGHAACRTAPGVEAIALPDNQGIFAPAAILDALALRGLRRVLIEGGAQTLSRFMSAGCLDRLHVVVAPVILGSGSRALACRPSCVSTRALRVPMHVRRLGDEVLFDCDLSRQT